MCGSLLGLGGADPRAPAGGPPLILFPGESALWREGSADAGPLDELPLGPSGPVCGVPAQLSQRCHWYWPVRKPLLLFSGDEDCGVLMRKCGICWLGILQGCKN